MKTRRVFIDNIVFSNSNTNRNDQKRRPRHLTMARMIRATRPIGSSKIVAARPPSEPQPWPASLKSEPKVCPQDGHCRTMPPISFGTRSCWPHFAHRVRTPFTIAWPSGLFILFTSKWLLSIMVGPPASTRLPTIPHCHTWEDTAFDFQVSLLTNIDEPANQARLRRNHCINNRHRDCSADLFLTWKADDVADQQTMFCRKARHQTDSSLPSPAQPSDHPPAAVRVCSAQTIAA